MTQKSYSGDNESHFENTCSGICEDGSSCGRGVAAQRMSETDYYCHDHEWQAHFHTTNHINQILQGKGTVTIKIEDIREYGDYGVVYDVKTQFGRISLTPDHYDCDIEVGGIYDMEAYVDPHNLHKLISTGNHVGYFAVDDLTDLSGLSQRKAGALVDAGYTTHDKIADADVDDLADVDGIGTPLAHRIQADI